MTAAENAATEVVPAWVEGAIEMARWRRYEHPDDETPQREIRTMVKALCWLARKNELL